MVDDPGTSSSQTELLDTMMVSADVGETPPTTDEQVGKDGGDGSGPTGSVVLDSLPYVDYANDEYEAYAASLIEHEMQSFQPNPRALDHLPNVEPEPMFGGRAPLARAEYAALVSRGGQPRPASESVDHVASEPTGPLASDEHAWRDSVRSAKVELEHQRNRTVNLELQQHFESDRWRRHNARLESAHVAPMVNAVSRQRMEVDTVNARRQAMQEEAAPKLQALGGRWDELIGKNQRLASATGMLDAEVQRMRKEAGMASVQGEATLEDVTVKAEEKKF